MMCVPLAMDAKNYLAVETTRANRRVEIRSIKPEDRAALSAAVAQASDQSLYRRFFTVRRRFSERQVDFFVNVDFINHVALVAIMEEDGKPAIVGGGRYVLIQPRKAELAFFVIDRYQGQGIGTLLMRHLILIARNSGFQELVAEVLSENRSMLGLFEKCGCQMTTTREGGVVHVALSVV